MLPGWDQGYERELAKLEDLGEQEVRYRLSMGTMLVRRELVLAWLESKELERLEGSGKRAELRAEKALALAEDANLEAREANVSAREANASAREANRIARRANRITIIGAIMATVCAIFSAWLSSRGGR